MSRVVRDLTVLCRLANQLHQRSSTSSLASVAVEALVDGIAADTASVWLVGPDGRLRRAAYWGNEDEAGDDHLLASLRWKRTK